MVDVGDTVSCRISFCEEKSQGNYENTKITLPGKVVWVHPAGRFYTIEVRLPNGRSFRTTEYFHA